VELIDFYGNPNPATSDSKVVLNSDKPDIVKVPSSVIVPKGSSFVSFPVTTFAKEGTAKISATSANFLPSDTEVTVKPFVPKLKISVDPIATPLVSNNDVDVKIFVDDQANHPQEGVTVNFNTDTNSTATPASAQTDSTGGASFILKALHGKGTTLTIVASKTGYPSETKTVNLDVLYVPGLEINWILYVAMAGAVGGVAIVAVYFLRKPKELSEEEQEEI
jgi:cytoskeletal protein RodZ